MKRQNWEDQLHCMKLSLNNILIIIVLMVLIFFTLAEKDGTYLNGSEIEVFMLLGATLGSLVFNSYYKNEFIEILNLVFVLFYICRIPFIFSDDMASDVVLRNVNINDIHWYITILIYQYLSLVICILVVNPKIARERISFLSEFIFRRVIRFSSFILGVNFYNTFFIWKYGVATLSGFFAILGTVFPIDSTMMLIILSVTMTGKEVLTKYKFSVIFCFILAISCFIYEGNKSVLLQIILMAYLAMVVVHGPFVFRLRSFFLTAIFGFISIALFFVGSAFRFYQRGQIDIDQFFDFIQNGTGSLSMALNSVSYRMGALDFFIEKISNPVYRPYVDLIYYFKALVDKLTPGFDIFYVPFMSRAIYNAYFGPTYEGTNSEQITLFAESHLLFGFLSFFAYVFILFVLKRSILNYRSTSGFAYGLYYMYILYLFYSWVLGYGLDMLVAELVYKGIFVFFTIWLIKRPSVKTIMHRV